MLMEAGNRGGNVEDSNGKVIIDSFGNRAVDNLVTVTQPDLSLSDLMVSSNYQKTKGLYSTVTPWSCGFQAAGFQHVLLL